MHLASLLLAFSLYLRFAVAGAVPNGPAPNVMFRDIISGADPAEEIDGVTIPLYGEGSFEAGLEDMTLDVELDLDLAQADV